MYKIKKVIRPDKNIYNNNYFFKTPKEYYKQAVKIINRKKISNLLDVGCSNGSFLYYAKSKIDCDFFGVEPLSNLISLAKNNVKDVKFIKAKLFDKKLNKMRNSFDVVTAMGVLGLFDNPKAAIERLLFFLKKKKWKQVNHDKFCK